MVVAQDIDTGRGSVVANEIPDGAINIDNDPSSNGNLGNPGYNANTVGGRGYMVSLRQRFDTMTTAWSVNRDQAINDDKYVAGDQWEDVIVKERTEEGRPMLTYNLLLTFCNQIVNQTRQEWPQIRVKPVDADASSSKRIQNVQGNKDYSMAEVMMGIIRNIEHVSRADQAYITAHEHQVQHGFGFFRAQPVYTRDDSFEQELKIFRVKNSYSVLIDPQAQNADYSDMQDCFIYTRMQKSTFERKYPNARMTTFENNEQGNTYEGWYDREALRVAEYFWIDYKQDTIVQLNNGMVVFKSDVSKILDELKSESSIVPVSERKVKRPVCMWQKMTATDILEGPVELPTSYVPVFPVLGRELIVDGETRYHSAIRMAKDAQKAYNYWQTAASESVALAPRAPWILTAKQIEGWEGDWEEANRRNLPFLLYNHQDNVAPPQRIFADQGAIAQLQQAAANHQVMQDIIGMHEANVGAASNERSGVAVRERAARGELSTYGFSDNLARAIEHLGRVLIQMIPKVYSSQRIMRIRMPDDTEDFIEINQQVVDEETGEQVFLNDLSYGKYDVVISTEPNFATQRAEAQSNILEAMQRLPPDKSAMISHLLIKNMDFPGADDMYSILRKMLPDELKTPDELAADLPPGITMGDDGQPVDADGNPWQKPPTPEQQIQQGDIEARKGENEAKLEKAKADVETAKAKMAEAQVKMAELQAGGGEGGGPDLQAMQGQMQQQIMGEVEKLVQQVIDIALEEHEGNKGAHEAMGIEDKITDATVSTLQRVKRVYDKKLQQLTPNEPAAGKSAGAGSPVTVMTGEIEMPKVRSIQFKRDADGITEAVPIYDESDDEVEAG